MGAGLTGPGSGLDPGASAALTIATCGASTAGVGRTASDGHTRDAGHVPESEAMPYEDQEDYHERMMLVRAEAEAANQAARRSATPSTPIEEYGHMPVPLREGMKAVTGWCLNTRVHAEFIKFCRCVGNKRAETTAALFRSSPDTTFPRYFGELGKSIG